MAQIRSLMELADMGFVIAFRFYGRYPETGRTFYHPPPCESDPEAVAAHLQGRRHSPPRRPSLAEATSLMFPSLSAPNLSVIFSSGANQHDIGGVPVPRLNDVRTILLSTCH